MTLFHRTIERSTALLTVGLFIAAIGLWTFFGMPRSVFPEINYPRVIVDVNMGYAPLPVIEWQVTAPLEKQLRAVPGVQVVRSTTSRGLSTIDVFLQESQDINVAVQRVTAKIAEARSSLPPDAAIVVWPMSAAALPSAEYCFTSTARNLRELRTFIEYTLKPLVLVIPGVYDVRVFGGDLPEYSVELDPKKMALHNLTVVDLDDRIRNSNTIDFIGPVERPDAELLAFGGSLTSTPQEIATIVVDTSLANPVSLGDLGTVKLANAWKMKQASLNGRECVALDVYYQAMIDQKVTSQAALATIQKAVAQDRGLAFRSWDLNDFTDTATNAVLLDLFVGMVIIGCVTYLFLRNLRYSVFALVIMPLSAAFAFLVMRRLGLSINLMTLGGLTAAIGLVVDNTVIVLEMYHRLHTHDPAADKRALLVQSLSAVAKPMIFGTATIALVFAPIAFISGVTGTFFAPMALVNASSLAISVVLALLLVPALVLLVGRDKGAATARKPRDFEASRFARAYRATLEHGLRRTRLLAVALLVVPLIGLVAVLFAKTGFLPEWDEGDLVIDFRSTTPVSLQTTAAKLKPLETFLAADPDVDFFIRKIGTGLSETDKPASAGEIIMKLKAARTKSVFQLRDEIGAQTGKLVPGFEFDLFQILPDRLNDLSGIGKPIMLYVRGASEALMDQAAVRYRDELAKVKGLDSVRIAQQGKAPEIHFTINEAVSRALELNPKTVTQIERFGLFSLDSSAVQTGPQPIPIRLRMQRSPTLALEDIPIYTVRGGLTRLGRVSKISTVNDRVQADHVDGQSVRTVTAEIAGRDLGSTVKDIQAAMAKTSVPGITAELGGEYQTQQTSFRQLLVAFLAGVALIFITALLFSNRLRVAAVLTLASLVPPAVGLVGIVAAQIPLDVSSFSGLISVTGIAVSNSFMALTAIELDPRFLADFGGAVTTGMVSRLRPILMTNLAAMAGFVPIAMSLSKGDEILRPFSIAVIIGLFGALYTTLVLVPALYAAFCRPPGATRPAPPPEPEAQPA